MVLIGLLKGRETCTRLEMVQGSYRLRVRGAAFFWSGVLVGRGDGVAVHGCRIGLSLAGDGQSARGRAGDLILCLTGTLARRAACLTPASRQSILW